MPDPCPPWPLGWAVRGGQPGVHGQPEAAKGSSQLRGGQPKAPARCGQSGAAARGGQPGVGG